MKIAVRIDDITPDMDWNSFYRFKELLDRYRIKPLLGVVPDNWDKNLQKGDYKENFWSYLQELQSEGYSLALHGFHHIYATNRGGIFPLNHFSEFAGIPYCKQKEMLSSAKQMLEEHGIETPIFMAPGHTYDKNTLSVLRELGFRYVTDGFAKTPYQDEKSGLIFLPIAFHSDRDITKKVGYTTLVYHLNGTSKEQFMKYEELIETYKNDFISFEDFLKVIPKKSTVLTKLKEKVMANSKFLIVRLREFIKRVLH